MELKYTKMQSDMEHIKITDLSIGDWVQAKQVKWDYDAPDLTPPMKIIAIDNREPNQAYVDLAFSDGVVAHSAFVEDLRPIPITPEILKKNGWLSSPQSDKIMVSEVMRYYFKGNMLKIFDIHTIYLEVKYIHELQRAMRLSKITDMKISL